MTWLPIKGYEGLYEVSDTGQVRSIDRVLHVTGQKDRLHKGRILAIRPNSQLQYYEVSLWKENKEHHFYVHRLVAQAFIPNPENLSEVNHIDGNRQNNNIDNLEWVDSQGNKLHAIRTGLKTYKNRLTEEEFLECLQNVIQGESYASLSERVPYKVPFLSTKLRKIARKYNLEDALNDSLLLQRQNRARINGNSHSRKTR